MQFKVGKLKEVRQAGYFHREMQKIFNLYIPINVIVSRKNQLRRHVMKTRTPAGSGLRRGLGIVIGTIAGLLGTTAWAGTITGTAHDLSGQGYAGGQICVVCHTPHGGNTSVTDAPLWNHAVTTATYSLYSSSTLNAGPLAQPSGVSKLGLSCHDGTVAIDSFGGATGGDFMTGPPAVGASAQGSLGNDHPSGFTYDAPPG